jgi:hypothetical protein
VNTKVSDNQRKFYLNEQLKSIKKELGVEKVRCVWLQMTIDICYCTCLVLHMTALCSYT